MSTTLWLKRRGPYLYPDDEGSTEVFSRLPTERSLFVEISQPRSHERLKLRWALVHIVAKAVGEDPEEISDKIKIAVGHYSELRFPDGRIDRRAKSISYAALDEIAFKEHLEKEIAAIYHLYDILPADAKKQLDEILSPKAERTR